MPAGEGEGLALGVELLGHALEQHVHAPEHLRGQVVITRSVIEHPQRLRGLSLGRQRVSPQNERQKAYAQAMIDQIHRQFIQVVKTGRGARLKETPETFSGLFWNGEEAVKLGLVDHTGGLDFVAREIVKAEDIVDYTQRENVAERLAKRFGASMGQVVVRTLRDLPSLR